MWRPYGGGEDEDDEVVVESARLSVCDIWLFSKCEAKMQHGSRLLPQAGLGPSIPKLPLALKKKMSSGAATNVNWHKRFREQLDNWNKGGVRAISYYYKERQYDSNYFKKYWQPMHENRQIKEKQPKSEVTLVPKHVVL